MSQNEFPFVKGYVTGFLGLLVQAMSTGKPVLIESDGAIHVMNDKHRQWILSCSYSGPLLTSNRDDDELDETFCSLPDSHKGRHRWWCDDGTVVVEWDDFWKLHEGRWRHHVPD